MENFENWLMESAADKRIELAQWAQKQVREKFRIPISNFVMGIDEFIAAFGIENFDTLKKYKLLKIEDDGPKRWIRFNITNKPKSVPSEEFDCRSCGQSGKMKDPRCWVCGASGPKRFETPDM